LYETTVKSGYSSKSLLDAYQDAIVEKRRLSSAHPTPRKSVLRNWKLWSHRRKTHTPASRPPSPHDAKFETFRQEDVREVSTKEVHDDSYIDPNSNMKFASLSYILGNQPYELYPVAYKARALWSFLA